MLCPQLLTENKVVSPLRTPSKGLLIQSLDLSAVISLATWFEVFPLYRDILSCRRKKIFNCLDLWGKWANWKLSSICNCFILSLLYKIILLILGIFFGLHVMSWMTLVSASFLPSENYKYPEDLISVMAHISQEELLMKSKLSTQRHLCFSLTLAEMKSAVTFTLSTYFSVLLLYAAMFPF